MYKNIVFDLYGTLVDIHTDEFQPEFWKKIADYYATHGVIYEPAELSLRYEELIQEQIASMPEGAEVDLGQVFADLYTEKTPSVLLQTTALSGTENAVVSARWTELSKEAQQIIRETALVFRQFSMKKLHLFDGVIEMLERIKAAQKKIYLLSNAQALFTEAELKITGLESYFDGILLSSDAGYKKPSAEFYRLLTKQYGVIPRESLMVGNDDVADCHGAAAAGMDSLYIYTEQSPKQESPLPVNCHQISSIRDVLQYI